MAAYQGVMPLHQSAMVACDAAPLVFNVVLARTIPRRPRAPGSALLKAETPSVPPPGGFAFLFAGRASRPAPRLTHRVVSVCRARSHDGRYSSNSGHSVAAQYRSRWAKALNRCAIARCAGSPTARTAIGVEAVDSVRVVLS